MRNVTDETASVRVGTCKCDITRAGKDEKLVFIEECYKESLCSTHCDAIAATYKDCTSHKAYFFPYKECPGSPFCKCGSDCNCPHGSGSGSGSDDNGEKL